MTLGVFMARKIGLATSAAFTLALSAATAQADTVPFGFTDAIVDYTVATTGLYSVAAFGAQGGAGAAHRADWADWAPK
jgi:hypothetical protein